MMSPRRLLPFASSSLSACVVAVVAVCSISLASAQQERHGRGYKPPPPTATVVVTVHKAANEKPMANASVIFRAMRNDETTANLEMKTDPDGHASLDLLEVGSHVTVQVIAGGFATYASDFDLTPDGKQVLVRMQRPRAQVSVYGQDTDRPAELTPGVQEHQVKGAQPAAPAQVSPAPAGSTPLKAVTPVPVPSATPGSSTVPSTPGAPQ